jgi:hypothetical protein
MTHAYKHFTPPALASGFPRQLHHKLRELTLLRFHFNLPAMLLHDDVVADRQAQARALSRRFRADKNNLKAALFS